MKLLVKIAGHGLVTFSYCLIASVQFYKVYYLHFFFLYILLGGKHNRSHDMSKYKMGNSTFRIQLRSQKCQLRREINIFHPLRLHKARPFHLLTQNGSTYSVRNGLQSVFPRADILFTGTANERFSHLGIMKIFTNQQLQEKILTSVPSKNGPANLKEL